MHNCYITICHLHSYTPSGLLYASRTELIHHTYGLPYSKCNMIKELRIRPGYEWNRHITHSLHTYGLYASPSQMQRLTIFDRKKLRRSHDISHLFFVESFFLIYQIKLEKIFLFGWKHKIMSTRKVIINQIKSRLRAC